MQHTESKQIAVPGGVKGKHSYCCCMLESGCGEFYSHRVKLVYIQAESHCYTWCYFMTAWLQSWGNKDLLIERLVSQSVCGAKEVQVREFKLLIFFCSLTPIQSPSAEPNLTENILAVTYQGVRGRKLLNNGLKKTPRLIQSC